MLVQINTDRTSRSKSVLETASMCDDLVHGKLNAWHGHSCKSPVLQATVRNRCSENLEELCAVLPYSTGASETTLLPPFLWFSNVESKPT